MFFVLTQIFGHYRGFGVKMGGSERREQKSENREKKAENGCSWVIVVDVNLK